MDINKFSFGAKLPALLTSILKAHFVAIDLELSGIHTKLANLRSGRVGGGKQTLQDRYTECKEAAEKYQVLQVGITCVEEDKTTGVYTARPYNFNLSPLIEYKIDLDRDFAFQSGAITFLLDHGFKFDNPIAIGVPYLSRQEEVDVRQRAQDRNERSKNMAELKVREDDTTALEFVHRVREQIRVWASKTPLEPDYLNIAPLGFEAQPHNTRGLNNFEKRLVHQLVRSEFPGFITLSKPTFIQIIAHNEAREASHRLVRENALNAQISKQTGLRWLVEAMLGGNLSGINPMDCAQNTTGESVFVDREAITSQIHGLRDALRGHQTILVGHNIFTDLINFYKTFIGDLPERVEDFQKIIHQVFPMVVDTKYLATHEYGPTNLRSSLEDLEEDLRTQALPIVKIHRDHTKYHSDSKVFAHEAGYDSFITAKAFIKLSARLEAEGDYVKVDSSDSSFVTAPESGGDLLDLSPDPPQGDAARVTRREDPKASGLPLDKEDGAPSPAASSSTRSSKRKQRRVRNSSVQIESQFSHPTVFDLLGSLDSGEDAAEGGGGGESMERDGRDGSESSVREDAEPLPAASDEPEVILMPSFNTDFWRVFGNKLRVFGTQEEIFKLAN